ncbi:MAG: GNAT family N-acetyltransferase [Pseudomonadales bacterium]
MFLVRMAKRADLGAFDPIDAVADQMFPAGRLPDVAADVPDSAYLPSLEQGWLRVAEVSGSVVGYLWGIAHEDVLHLQQLSVHPDQGRRGIGRGLLEDVIHAAAAGSMRAVTLTTFADIPWNAPFYRSAGFEDITGELTYPHVDAALRHERALGMTRRIGMVRHLDAETLMHAHVAAMYEHNARDRMLCINDWLKRPAPLFWMGRTANSWSWRLRSDLPIDQSAALEAALRSWRWTDSASAVETANQRAEMVRLLADLGVAGETVSGPTFVCRKNFTHPLSGRYQTRAVTAAQQGLLRDGLEAWVPDVAHQQPFVVSLDDDQAVSVCASVRITQTAHAAGVETLPAFRRRGHGVNAVAAWAARVQAAGALALYSTTWDNAASRAVATRLQMVEFGWEMRIG